MTPKRAIKAILLLNTMREQFNSKAAMAGSSGSSPGVKAEDLKITDEQRREIGATFDMFDR
jgi:hypothetical protein